MGYAIRTDRYRYAEWVNRKTGHTDAGELYDHQNDPGENTNLLARGEAHPLVPDLRRQLWQALGRPDLQTSAADNNNNKKPATPSKLPHEPYDDTPERSQENSLKNGPAAAFSNPP